jgi:hypothetical protein
MSVSFQPQQTMLKMLNPNVGAVHATPTFSTTAVPGSVLVQQLLLLLLLLV